MTTKMRRPSRRTFIKQGAAAAAVIAAAPSIITPSRAADNFVVVNTWGGSWTNAENEAFYKTFTKETGIEVKTSTPVSFAKLKAQVETGNYEWDVSSLNPASLKRADSDGLVEPLDWNIIDKAKANVPVYANGLGYIALATLLAYRTDKFPNGGPQTWADFWDVDKFPGNRSLYNRAFTGCGFGLVADGVAHDKVYPMDIDRAFKSLDRIKKHIRVWWKQGNQSQQLLADGEVDMMCMWSGRAAESIARQKVPAAVSWIGHESYNSYWYVAKGTPRREQAMRFLEYGARADLQAKFCITLPYGPLNPDAFQYIDAETSKWLATNPEHKKVGYFPDADWLAPNLASLNERWSQWISS